MQSLINNSHEVFIHIHQGCFAGIGAIVRLPQCQWSKPDGYWKIIQYITTTKHSKAKTVCIFLGIYCREQKTSGCNYAYTCILMVSSDLFNTDFFRWDHLCHVILWYCFHHEFMLNKRQNNIKPTSFDIWLLCNSSPASATYMCQWTGSSLIQVMACRLLGATP